MFECTRVFYSNWNSTAKVVINQGGTSSSKTYSIMQVLFLKAVYEKGSVITVTGESIPNLKKGAYRDAETIYSRSEHLRVRIESWNKSERIIYFRNGSIIEFISNLDEQSAKNGKRDYLFANELNGISWPIFFQLALRTRKQVFADYNPSARFFAHEKLIGTDPSTNDLSATVELIISDHRMNCFLTEEEHYKIENIKDPELHKVYARGLTGNITGIIYPDWTRIPDNEFPNEEEFVGGGDWGWTNAPSAGTKVCRIGDNIFAKELYYTPGLAPEHVVQIFKANGFTSSTPIWADKAPENIASCRRLGLLMYAVNKPPGSVNSGITRLKQFKVFYTASSVNIQAEREKYVWLIDPVTGKPTNTPIDQFNHLMDAIRYAVFSRWPVS